MSLLKPIIAGAAISLVVSFLFHSLEGNSWDLLAIMDFDVIGYSVHWSWPVFAIATALAWVLQKALQE